MDPKLLVAEGDACLSLAQELFDGCDLRCQSLKTKNKVGRLLLHAIKNYEEALKGNALEEGLRGKVEANLQGAHEMLRQLQEIIAEGLHRPHVEGLEEYPARADSLDEMPKEEES